MRDLFRFFERRYSAVNVIDTALPRLKKINPAQENLNCEQHIDFIKKQRKKSLQANRSLNPGSTIVDSFFSQRKDGKRQPKGK